MTITPAQLEFADDGCTPYSSRFDDIYHSAQGAQQQAQAVFLAGNQLPQRWQERDCFTIIETGFGQGISFLSTWQAWRNDPQRSERLHFISVEQFPFARDDLARLHQQYPDLAELSRNLLRHWPHLTPGFHRIWLDDGRVSLTLLFGDVLTMLHEVVAKVDAIYLDGFSPGKNPQMWCLPVFKALWRLCKIDTTLATYTVAGDVRRGLTEAGFSVQKVQGFANKRQMLTGQCARLPKPPRLVVPSKPQHCDEKSAIVIGAGIAGCSVAASLVQRGWHVRIFEADKAVAQHASGNHVGLSHPTFSKDDNALARLSRAGFALARQQLQGLAAHGVHFGLAGQFQVAKDEVHEALMRETVNELGFPSELVQFLDVDQAEEKLGTRPARGGWWFSEALWLNPPSLCKGYLSLAKYGIDLQLDTPVASMKESAGYWQLFDAEGQSLAQTGTLILANATAAIQLIPQANLPLSQTWRAVTQIPAQSVPETLPSCSGNAYLTAAFNGWRSLGAAAYQAPDVAAVRDANLAALTEILPELKTPATDETHTRVCARPNSLDRLPLVGALHAPIADQAQRAAVHQLFQMPREPGLYAVLGLGSRGMTWHALAAEIIACQLNQEPLPIERSLLNALDPARFELRTLRRGKATD
ncbi:bifunctional tRNA (5-methylaminomethyl-2-thiouridine)(34)-methyltransferase MnmD/FAD-dependent 5-carboxymethylaminomethyl-2-thiouridine(34) oxidoreductase MnmC [Chitinibacter sp. S2-10]|uniref:bifunctional tRNA (5-methylaminomethyl-2-thiouridine)(34)-methyltransferase MnmD/FAD-dependent 5-carboxymethylaminomethyl-2-thiouridine(34) oxidoreductase MnmC n=1 Tax=Chitinibacter sp. S2-10 TaxID=3373597 RepID=UPI0039779D58